MINVSCILICLWFNNIYWFCTWSLSLTNPIKESHLSPALNKELNFKRNKLLRKRNLQPQLVKGFIGFQSQRAQNLIHRIAYARTIYIIIHHQDICPCNGQLHIHIAINCYFTTQIKTTSLKVDIITFKLANNKLL